MAIDLSGLDIDAVLCINLKERSDRRDAMRRTFSGSGLDIEFFSVDKDEEDPQRGSYYSHLACARIALERNYRRTLIFEDDCTLEPFAEGTVGRINRFLKEEDPELFYLGILLIGKIWLTWRRNIARCRVQGAHAYILSKKGCEKVVGFGDYCGKAMDSVFSKRFKGYCVFPIICFQDSNSPSDLQAFRDELNRKNRVEKIPVKAKSFLAEDRKRQYLFVLKNFHKTLLFR
jgi:glycosyl transferase family 25